eukprot:9468749-Pyramimonas_sp.AAC.1
MMMVVMMMLMMMMMMMMVTISCDTFYGRCDPPCKQAFAQYVQRLKLVLNELRQFVLCPQPPTFCCLGTRHLARPLPGARKVE